MLVDVHCHLNFKDFDPDRDQVINKAVKTGLNTIINSGTNHKENIETLELASKYKNIIKASLGIYPIEASKLSEEELNNELDFIKSNKDKIIAIGEVGLDFKLDNNYNKQKSALLKIIELSEKINKPLIIHSRQAEKEVVEILESSRTKNVNFHCFMGNFKLVKKIVDNGWFLSIPPIILRSLHFQGLVNMVPINHLLTETDSPFLSPPPKMRNEPSNVKLVVEKISELKNMNYDETVKNIFANFQKIFLKK